MDIITQIDIATQTIVASQPFLMVFVSENQLSSALSKYFENGAKAITINAIEKNIVAQTCTIVNS